MIKRFPTIGPIGTPLAAMLAFFLATTGGSALAADVEITRQALVLVRALAYDRNLPDRAGSSVSVGILYKADAGGEVANQAHDAFTALGGVKVGGLPLESTLIPWTDSDALKLSLKDGGVDAVYVVTGFTDEVEAIKTVTRENDILTLAGERSYIDAGMSVGVFDKGGEPKLAINLPASKAEGASFSAELLRLAEVIR